MQCPQLDPWASDDGQLEMTPSCIYTYESLA